MLQVYDRVLGSGSMQTLILLTVIMVLAYLTYGALDAVRDRLALRVSLRLERLLAEPLVRGGWRNFNDPLTDGSSLIDELDRYRKFIGGPGLIIITDLPFTPLFIIAITGLHPWLGLFSLCAAVLMILLGLITQFATSRRLIAQTIHSQNPDRTVTAVSRAAESTRAFGLTAYFTQLWRHQRHEAIIRSASADDLMGAFRSMTKAIRYCVQSLILGIGALLVLQNEISPGVMIAASIIMGRALAPIDLAIGSWRQFLAARSARSILDRAFDFFEKQNERQSYKIQKIWGHLALDNVSLIPQDSQSSLFTSLSLEIPANASVGIIGVSGSGKSSLLKLFANVIEPSSGAVRIDGFDAAILKEGSLGKIVGYLGHELDLHEGTIEQNISRFTSGSEERVYSVARQIGIHERILELPDGYQSRIGAGTSSLSHSELRRITLARAIFDTPKLIFLDEPECGLDEPGLARLQNVLSDLNSSDCTLLVATNRVYLIDDFDYLLFIMPNGRIMYGPTQNVLTQLQEEPEVLEESDEADQMLLADENQGLT